MARATAAVNLTGNGKRDAIRYDRVQLDADEEGVDLSAPQYFTMLGEWTKKGGIARVAPGKPGAEALAWDDAGYGRLLKAKNADTLAYTRDTGKDYPDFYVSDLAMKNARRITDGQAQVEPYAWSTGGRIIDYTSDAPTTAGNAGVKGKKLQGALYLPANYEPGKKYPTIVYIYEKLSDSFNRFVQPTGERLQQVGVHQQRLRGADAGHHLHDQRSRHVRGVVRAAGAGRGDRHRRRRSRARRAARATRGAAIRRRSWSRRRTRSRPRSPVRRSPTW